MMSVEEDHQGMGEGVHIMGEGQRVISGRTISICQMCHGKGYYEEVAKPEVGSPFGIPDVNSDHNTYVLPSIIQPLKNTHGVEELYKAKNLKALSRVSDSAVPVTTITKPHSRFPPVHLSTIGGRKACSTAGPVKSNPDNAKRDYFSQVHNLIPTPIRPEKHPEDAVRLAVIKLNRNDWETRKSGLEECLSLAHFNPEELEPHMSIVYRTMSSILNNFRPQVTLFVCQAAREFFSQMRSTCRPEFDEVVFSLLNRTADTNRHIKLYANDALDKMVTYIPTVHAVRPLVEKGPTHNNPLVRTATARLLTCIVALKTPNAILTQPTLQDTCKKILEAAALLLADSNLDTRAMAKKLFQRFLNEEEFESAYYADVDEKLRQRVDRALTELKYKSHLAARN